MQGFKPRGQREEELRQQQVAKGRANNGTQSNQKKLKPTNPRALGSAGLLSGPGTGTSDGIETTMPAGSYIMPADSTEQISPEALADLGSPADVRVSNGEYEMPPEQVHAVGAQVLDTIKDQTHTPTAKGFRPDISRNGEQFFSSGGLTLGSEEAKRRAALKAPVGIALTPEQQDRNKRDDWRKQSAERQNQFKADVAAPFGMAKDTLVGQTKAWGSAIANTTFDDRLPGQADRDAKRAVADKARASQWVSANPEQAQQAGLGMRKLAGRATSGINIPPKPLPGIGGAPMPAPQQAGAELPAQQSTQQTDQQPEIDPMTGQEITAKPANESIQSRHGTDTTKQTDQPDPSTGYVQRTDQERRDFARSNKVDGVPTLTSEMAKTINPNSINTMSSEGMMGLGSQSSQGVSQALKAAAERGDWGAVQNHYAKQGQSFGGQGLNGIGNQGQGTRVTVVRDPTRMPSNAEIMQQRMQSAQMRNADAGRRTDIEGQRVAAGIGNDQFRNQIQSREVDIAGRNQDLAERQAEPTIAQQQRLQALYTQYDQADDAGKARIAQQINQLSGKNDSLKDNFLTAGGGQEWDSQGGLMRNVPQRVIDLRTGQEIGSGNEQPAQKAPAVGYVRGQYRFKGGNPADQNNWEKI